MPAIILCADFKLSGAGLRSAGLDSRLSWLHPPINWRVDALRECLVLDVDGPSDFWQQTHYGFRVDSGHFLGIPIEGNIRIVTHVRLTPVHRYDQAGLMLRYSPSCWAKASVEFESEGEGLLGAVVTNRAQSDWSFQEFKGTQWEYSLRITAQGNELLIEHSDSISGPWRMIRMAYLAPETEKRNLMVGIYACSPTAPGARAEFTYLAIEAV